MARRRHPECRHQKDLPQPRGQSSRTAHHRQDRAARAGRRRRFARREGAHRPPHQDGGAGADDGDRLFVERILPGRRRVRVRCGRGAQRRAARPAGRRMRGATDRRTRHDALSRQGPRPWRQGARSLPRRHHRADDRASVLRLSGRRRAAAPVSIRRSPSRC